jgi:hypothetical protein
LKKFRTEWLRPAPARGLRGTVYEVRDPVEKPDPRDAPSDLANVGHYVLTPDLFLILEDTPPDSPAEIRLTNGLRVLREGSLNPALLWKLTSPVTSLLNLTRRNVKTSVSALIADPLPFRCALYFSGATPPPRGVLSSASRVAISFTHVLTLK